MDPGPESPFFVGRAEQAFTARTLHQLLTRHGLRAGVANCHPHRFRHTYALYCFREGMDPVTVQKTLGHSDLTMTRRRSGCIARSIG